MDQGKIGSTVQSFLPVNAKTRRRKWVFTLNGYSQLEIEQLNRVFGLETKRYIFQEEKGANGNIHLQGCFILNKSKYLSWLKNNISSRAHFEPMNNEKASFDYCSKEETRNGLIYKNEEGKPYDVIAHARHIMCHGDKCTIDDDIERSNCLWCV